MKRKRASLACSQCHQLKAKCSGGEPCTRCSTRGQSCNYSPAASDTSSSGLDRTLHAAKFTSITSSAVEATLLDRIDKDSVQRYLEAYFDQNDSAGRVFLHKASTLSSYHEGSLNPLLLLALCGLGSRLIANDRKCKDSETWMAQVESTIMSQLGEISIPRLQALTLLLHHRRMTAKRNELWMLLSFASRMAFTLSLHMEDPRLPAVQQECNRRLMWSLYTLDSLGCGGLDALSVCSASQILIQLPCDDHSFSLGVVPSTARLTASPLDKGRPEDVLAKTIRLLPVRHQVLKYA